MFKCSISLTVSTLGLVLHGALAIPAQAVTFQLGWTGQIAGFRIDGAFGYDETRNYTDGIVRTGDLDFLTVSFLAPDGSLLRTYANNHLDPGVNFNFDTRTQQILQYGNFNDPDGINIGAPNYDRESGNDPSQARGLSFWSKPPRSSVPHVHFDDWANEFGFPVGFGSHEDVAFFERTTAQLLATGRVGEAYRDSLAQGATLNDFGQPMTAAIPEPSTILGLSLAGVGGWMARKRRRIAVDK
ncbi:PEP-CTERM sorting domain-containing protein [Leptothermofonsia sichuanensis E412]|uniref:PEP-CTERM sorting domain-containing protein n=1 Tax=Leptothermofonsia sichuanensis TaxID=2917832 RepID=UPI001CA62598|nr:PEP-CTERM sorting domain-containing protein [Leptothermofonsia sichuanensis]QZZ19293.1 PEP-CTERM sorting domain-containing protein [Leptothermofonsia sichuanensis E412]